MQAIVFDPPQRLWPVVKLAAMATPRAWIGWLGGLRLRDVPEPALPRGDWVRLRTILGGICGSDLSLISLRNHPATFLQRFASFPAVLGHENVSIIEQIGPDVRNWRVGQRVCVDPCLSCAPRAVQPICPQCAAGKPSLCDNVDRGTLPPGLIIGLNSRTGGTWSRSFVAHESQLFAVPDDIPDEIAILTDPVACSLHAVLRRPPQPGESVLITGAGIVALAVMASIRALGRDNSVTCVVRHAFQRDLMLRFGATDARIHPRSWSNARRHDDIASVVRGRRIEARFGNQMLIGGFDLTYDCVGSGPGLSDAMKWTRPRGTVVAVGTSQIAVVDTTPLWFTELNLVGCNGRAIEELDGRRLHTYQLVFELIRSGKLRLDGLLTHRFRLADYRAAFQTIATRGRAGLVKAAFTPD